MWIGLTKACSVQSYIVSPLVVHFYFVFDKFSDTVIGFLMTHLNGKDYSETHLWRIYNAKMQKILKLEMIRIFIDLMHRQLHNIINLVNYFTQKGQVDFNTHYVGF